VTVREVARSLKAGRLELRPQHSWPRATVLASSWPFRIAFSLLSALRSNLPRFRRRLTWLRAQVASATTRRVSGPGVRAITK
jgi:hypothetical protein